MGGAEPHRGLRLLEPAGLLCAAEMARALGQADEAARWAAQAEDYRAAIDRALQQAGTPWIPPSFEGEGTHWGNLECLFPTPLFAPDDPRVGATLEEVRHRFGGGFVEGTIRWSPASTAAIHPYMSQFVTNAELVRGRQAEALEGFYSFLLHTTATHGFPEGVFYRIRTAWGDTVPHLWAAGLYVITLRNLLVREFEDELHLSSAVPPPLAGAGEDGPDPERSYPFRPGRRHLAGHRPRHFPGNRSTAGESPSPNDYPPASLLSDRRRDG